MPLQWQCTKLKKCVANLSNKKNLLVYLKEFETAINLAGTVRSPAGKILAGALEQLKNKNIAQTQKILKTLGEKFEEQAAILCFMGLLAFARNQKTTGLKFIQNSLLALLSILVQIFF